MYVTNHRFWRGRSLSTQLCPDYVGIELGIGESILVKAIGESTGRSLAIIKADLKKEGDLGLVAMVCRSSFPRHRNQLIVLQNSKNSQKVIFKPKRLTVPFVFSNLKEIASSSGHSVRCLPSLEALHAHYSICSHKPRRYRLSRSF